MSDVELLACAHCGGVGYVENEDDDIPWVECETCGAQGPPGQTVPEAIAAWNLRASGWLDIAGAPKDGRTLLLGYLNKLGNWRTTRGQWMSQDYIDEFWEDPEGVEPGWYETCVESDELPNCWPIDPTHYMPLPPPPITPPEGQKT